MTADDVADNTADTPLHEFFSFSLTPPALKIFVGDPPSYLYFDNRRPAASCSPADPMALLDALGDRTLVDQFSSFLVLSLPFRVRTAFPCVFTAFQCSKRCAVLNRRR